MPDSHRAVGRFKAADSVCVLKAAEMGGARLVDGEVVGIHPHPDPLPSRERGNASTPAPPSERGSANPLSPSSERGSANPLPLDAQGGIIEGGLAKPRECMNPLRHAALAASPFCSRKKGTSEGIILADGSTIEADAVLLAMGPWSKSANDWLGFEIYRRAAEGRASIYR